MYYVIPLQTLCETSIKIEFMFIKIYVYIVTIQYTRYFFRYVDINTSILRYNRLSS